MRWASFSSSASPSVDSQPFANTSSGRAKSWGLALRALGSPCSGERLCLVSFSAWSKGLSTGGLRLRPGVLRASWVGSCCGVLSALSGVGCFSSSGGLVSGVPTATVCSSTAVFRSLRKRVSSGTWSLTSSGTLTICCSGTAGGGCCSSWGCSSTGSGSWTCGGAWATWGGVNASGGKSSTVVSCSSGGASARLKWGHNRSSSRCRRRENRRKSVSGSRCAGGDGVRTAADI